MQQELSDLLSGALSQEDEEGVEAELNELIAMEHQNAIDILPTVPSEELPVTIPGILQYFIIKLYSKLNGF